MPSVKLKQDESGNLILPISEKLMKEVGWEIGDSIEWSDNGDGSWTMTKKVKTKLVMVETVSSFRIRYVVELPEDAEEEMAHDRVLNDGDIKEFSQVHISEEVSGSRVVTNRQYLKVFNEDNMYLRSWKEDSKFTAFVNKWDNE
tara:strand:- start:2540 stop:2971 length:432 start_codon:yes stop_codon:yes gene_type:complete